MRNDGEFLASMIKRHIAVNIFPSTSFEPGLLYSITGMDGDFDVRKNADGSLVVSILLLEYIDLQFSYVIYITS